MKVTLNWLKQYVDFDWSPEELAERLTMLGLEVEGMQKLAGEFEGIVVAQILTRDNVPGSDKLSVCKVNDGQGERTIICGAQNHKAGDKVPLILPNYALPLKSGEREPFVIKERRVFGIVSQGMMCSPKELGLADEADGLLILREDATPGQPFAEYLGRTGSDVVYDLEVTPNRPDLNSVIGIAREIAAATGNALKLPEVKVEQASSLSGQGKMPVPTCSDLIRVRIEDAELCPRYVARVVRSVKIGRSPDWLRSTLEKVGFRSINNVVDVTNYVMLETGQPLHAFDYRLVEGLKRSSVEASPGSTVQPFNASTPTIVIRRAQNGELFVTLDGQKRTLSRDVLLIADETKPIALAGVMGGQNTEINEQTKDVLIESAYFKPTNIRRTSKALDLRTDASYRFERGADIGITDWASQRCAQWIIQTAGGQLADGAVDAYPKPFEPTWITLRHRKVNELLGIELKPHDIDYYLGQLGLKTANRKPRPVDAKPAAPEPVTFRIPSFRVDLKREIDLIEEVARLYGVEKIPATPPRGAIGTNAFDAVYDQITEARRILTGLGLTEAQGQTLVSRFGSELRDAKDEALVALANPLSSDMDVLRPSLIPGLLDALRHNLHHKNGDVALFEIGRVFKVAQPSSPAKSQAGKLCHVEERRLAIALTGHRHQLFWSGAGRDARFDIYDLKGLLEAFFEPFGLRGITWSRRAEGASLFLESALVQLGGKLTLGEAGQVSPLLAKQHDLRDPVLLAELNFDALLARRNTGKSFKPLPQFPSIRRDIAMLVPESTTHEAVLKVVKQAKPANLESVELFDIFRGQHVPAGRKSMAYAFTYRHAERTLTDVEVNTAHEKLVEQCRQMLQATVR
ncbi:MAG: phenylalanine--tRNA ligase subunit beta [Verrucomicrobia bacterium]|nr:MAG: phenylalanine--tRNA ligase subunit beta [Verrucomicrobiota bacterium]